MASKWRFHVLTAEDAVRLYEQGWSFRQAATRFECGYGAMRCERDDSSPTATRRGAWGGGGPSHRGFRGSPPGLAQ